MQSCSVHPLRGAEPNQVLLCHPLCWGCGSSSLSSPLLLSQGSICLSELWMFSQLHHVDTILSDFFFFGEVLIWSCAGCSPPISHDCPPLGTAILSLNVVRFLIPNQLFGVLFGVLFSLASFI